MDSAKPFDASSEGRELRKLVETLHPLCRSITGNGLRGSLRVLQGVVPLEIREVPSGTPVFDWVIPPEWNIRDAWIKDSQGRRVVDFHRSALHVVGYSMPVRRRIPLAELKTHLHSLPDRPDWIPYRTSYYKENWGFCVTHRQRESLTEPEYEVCIDSTLAPGHLSYGELFLPGETGGEILISAHSCHPALCNDNLSGMAVAARLALHLSGARRRLGWRFLWAPGTIGALAWLAANPETRSRIAGGLVLTCVGDPGTFNYKRTREGGALVDRAVEHVLGRLETRPNILDYSPLGYDERQYNSPGIRLPVGAFMRTPNGRYPEYHTSADDLSLVQDSAMADSLLQLLRIAEVLDGERRFRNLQPQGEPQLGRRGLYSQTGGAGTREAEEALLWVLNFSDGAHGLLDIANRSKLAFPTIAEAARRLEKAGLLAPCPQNAG